MRLKVTVAGVVLSSGLLALGGALFAQAAQAAPAGTCPPENVFVKVVEPSGPALWIDFIGSGCGGDSPVRDPIRSMTADGFFLRSDGTCGQTKTKACVVIGP